MVLDDNDAVRESLEAFFEDRRGLVFPAATAEEALEILQSEKPDGATVDIRLPGMDGNDFLRKASELQPNIACVIITGSPEYRLPDDIGSMPHVAALVFAKPVSDLDALECTLRRHVEACKGSEQPA